MTTKKRSVRLICPVCGSLVTVSANNNKCKCGASFSVGVRRPGKVSSHKKQDALLVPRKVRSFVMQFIAIVIVVWFAILIIANNGG